MICPGTTQPSSTGSSTRAADRILRRAATPRTGGAPRPRSRPGPPPTHSRSTSGRRRAAGARTPATCGRRPPAGPVYTSNSRTSSTTSPAGLAAAPTRTASSTSAAGTDDADHQRDVLLVDGERRDRHRLDRVGRRRRQHHVEVQLERGRPGRQARARSRRSGAARPRGRRGCRRPSSGARTDPGATARGRRRPTRRAPRRRPPRPGARPRSRRCGRPGDRAPTSRRAPADPRGRRRPGAAAAARRRRSPRGPRRTVGPRPAAAEPRARPATGRVTSPSSKIATSLSPRLTLRRAVSSSVTSRLVRRYGCSSESGLTSRTARRRASSAGRPSASSWSVPTNG